MHTGSYVNGTWYHPDSREIARNINPADTSDVIEISAGDAANIPALAFHHAWNVGTETCEILWWVPGEMHTDEWKEKIHKGEGKWYER